MNARTQSVKAESRSTSRKPETSSGVASAALDKSASSAPSTAQREFMIREAAYFRAERRAFAPGGELEDWFGAEREIDGMLAQSRGSRAPVAEPAQRA